MTVSDELETVAAQLRALSTDEFTLADDAEIVRAGEVAGLLDRLVGSINIALAAQIAYRSRVGMGSAGLAAQHGKTKPSQLVEQVARVSNAEATKRIALGLALQAEPQLTGWERPARFPILASAVEAGEIGGDAALSIVRCVDQAQRTASDAASAAAEQVLVTFAQSETPDSVAVLARRVRDRLDPDGVVSREEETHLRRGIRLGREQHGIRPISGGLDPVFAALLEAEFSAAGAPGAMPRFLPSDAGATDSSSDVPVAAISLLLDVPGTRRVIDSDGEEVIRLVDDRTVEQRQHDVLFGLVKAGIRNTGDEAGSVRSTADVTAIILSKDLEERRGAGHLEGVDEAVSAVTVEQLLCDARYRVAVLGNDGEPLAIGKTRYSFTAAQRRAILLRDGDHCLCCDAPAAWGDFHHIIPFNADGGRGMTEVSNGVNLCPRHHSLFHHSKWKLRMRGGRPEILAPPYIDSRQKWQPASKTRIIGAMRTLPRTA